MQVKASVRGSESARVARSACLPSVRPVPLHSAPFRAGCNGKRASVAAFAAAQEEGTTTEYKYERVRLTSDDNDVSNYKIPEGYHWYETMMIMKPTLSDEERDKELAKFEAYLNKEECMHINALVRGRSRMAYPIKSNWEGIYVLYTYAAKRQTAKNIQVLLSRPESGAEDNILRHLSFCRL